MRQFIALAGLAAIAVAGWLYWPTIKAKFFADQENPAPAKEPTPPTPPAPSSPAAANSTPDPAAKTSMAPDPALPGTKTSDPTSPGGNAEKTPERPVSGKTLRVDFAADLVTLGPMSTVEGTTTLPVGARLEMQATPEGDDPAGGRLPAEVVIVTGGSPRNVFRWVPSRLVSAKSFRVTAILRPESQPGSVQQLIGPRGELLAGNLVVPAPGGNYLHAISAPFSPPTGASATAKSRRLKLVFKSSGTERGTVKDKAP